MFGAADPIRSLHGSGVASPKNHHEVPKMSKPVEDGFAGRSVVAFAFATMLSVCACAPESRDPPDITMFDMGLTQGTTQEGLWQSRTVAYCFARPLLAEMPSHVRTAVQTQANLDTRFERRKQEFIAAINATWQAVGVLELVPRPTCGTGMFVVRYDKDTPTGGYAGLGMRGGLAVGIQMDSEFLGNTYGWGSNTYHTFIAVHEVGHTLGFRHEQDRADSSCHVSQDFSGTGIALTGFDANSVMNYCNRQATALTALDRAGFERAYAFLTDDGSDDEDSCRDTNQWCSAWADRGECSRNPGYMLANCCDSCGAESSTCQNSHSSCDDWAARGECSANPAYMLTNCCSSCNAEAPRLVARGSGKCMDVAAGGASISTQRSPARHR